MKDKKDIGNLNNKEFGVELDPNKDLCLTEDAEKGQKAYYKGSEMKYLDYMAEVGDRIQKGRAGKGTTNSGSYAGFGKGTLKKSYKKTYKE